MGSVLRIGSVPYLNGKPLVDWFHTPEAAGRAEIAYAVPSKLATMLREDEIDVANCSIFEGLQRPGLVLIPDISISADGAVKSVRLFSRVPIGQIRSVALDTSSLTSSALTRILLREAFGISPQYVHHPPELDAMLSVCDAGLLIGDLKLFGPRPGTTVYDLGIGWKELTGMPFVYAGWLAREDCATVEMARLLIEAKRWGVGSLEMLAEKWSQSMDLPLERCQDYFLNVMDYDLTGRHLAALHLFQQKCAEHGLIPAIHALPILEI